MEREGTNDSVDHKEELLDEFGYAFEKVTLGHTVEDCEEECIIQDYYLEKNPDSDNILDRYFILPSGIVLLFSAFKENTWNISLSELGNSDDFSFLLKLEQYASELKRKNLNHTTMKREDVRRYPGVGIRLFSYSNSRDLRLITDELKRRHKPYSEPIDK